MRRSPCGRSSSSRGRGRSLPHATAAAASKKIDLRTKDGRRGRQGRSGGITTSRSSRSTTRAPTASPPRPTTSSPRRSAPTSTTATGRSSTPTTLKNPRGGGQVCFAWYRIKVTIPEEAAGKSVFFQTTVDDYGEVWVDGKLPYKPGDTGGPSSPVQRAEPRRAEGRQAGQGLPDRRLRHQRPDLRRARATGSSWGHVPGAGRQEVKSGRTNRRGARRTQGRSSTGRRVGRELNSFR